eukprot:361763-Chlamydomonas_euryale.AAC.4
MPPIPPTRILAFDVCACHASHPSHTHPGLRCVCQIRCQLAHEGCPLLGDVLYAALTAHAAATAAAAVAATAAAPPMAVAATAAASAAAASGPAAVAAVPTGHGVATNMNVDSSTSSVATTLIGAEPHEAKTSASRPEGPIAPQAAAAELDHPSDGHGEAPSGPVARAAEAHVAACTCQQPMQGNGGDGGVGSSEPWHRLIQEDPLKPFALQASRLEVLEAGPLGMPPVVFEAGTPWWRAAPA